MRDLLVVDLGRAEYGDVLALQRELCQARVRAEADTDLLLLVEHPDVVTLGRGTKRSSLPLDEATLRGQGYAVYDIERGGDVTYHGPGQLVGYPVLDLNHHRQDLHWYLRQLESVLIDTLAAVGIDGGRVEGLTGVWTDGRKIASIGVHVKRWVTFHGFALNVATNLSRFDNIVPCGIDGVVMTSILHEKNNSVDASMLWRNVVAAVVDNMGRTFERLPATVPVAALPQFGYSQIERSHGCL